MSDLNAVSRLALKNYIDSARKLAIYGGESGWHSNRWETTTLRNRLSLDFCELRRKGANVAVPWQSPFLSSTVPFRSWCGKKSRPGMRRGNLRVLVLR